MCYAILPQYYAVLREYIFGFFLGEYYATPFKALTVPLESHEIPCLVDFGKKCDVIIHENH